jgi:hypothetical protein
MPRRTWLEKLRLMGDVATARPWLAAAGGRKYGVIGVKDEWGTGPNSSRALAVFSAIPTTRRAADTYFTAGARNVWPELLDLVGAGHTLEDRATKLVALLGTMKMDDDIRLAWEQVGAALDIWDVGVGAIKTAMKELP